MNESSPTKNTNSAVLVQPVPEDSLGQRRVSVGEAAQIGHTATDKLVTSGYSQQDLLTLLCRYGHSLIQFDPEAERRLRRKIDLFIMPTVAILYLFCFIDRANIGMQTPQTPQSTRLTHDRKCPTRRLRR
jgi:hypothetical protein